MNIVAFTIFGKVALEAASVESALEGMSTSSGHIEAWHIYSLWADGEEVEL